MKTKDNGRNKWRKGNKFAFVFCIALGGKVDVGEPFGSVVVPSSCPWNWFQGLLLPPETEILWMLKFLT